jgi:hypothetical protein
MTLVHEQTILTEENCINTKVRNDLIAMVWKDERNVKLLINTHCPSCKGDFCDEDGTAL